MEATPRCAYEIRVPLEVLTPEQQMLGQRYITIARALTPAGAGEVIRAVCENPAANCDHIRVEIRIVI